MSKYYAAASYDDYCDIIGVVSGDKSTYDADMKKFCFHSVFEDEKSALREAKRLSKNGAFFVGNNMREQYLVFSSKDKDGNECEYLTTRETVAKVLEHNQENGIEWETVDAVLEDYASDKEVGVTLGCWLDGQELQTRNCEQIRKLEFYTQKRRNRNETL